MQPKPSSTSLAVPYEVAVLMTDADEALARNDRAVAEALVTKIYGFLDELHLKEE